MARVRRRTSVLAVALLAALLAGCGAEPAPVAPPPADPPPTAPVGADGQPITSLCDLLSVNDFSQVAGLAAAAPAAKDATPTEATCDFGSNLTLIVTTRPSIEDAMGAYQQSQKPAWFADSVKQGPIGGVDQSVYGTGPAVAALSVRRLKLVVTIAVPAKQDSEATLVQLAGRVLSRANALGA
jgi:hypothetical protein